MFGPDAAQPTKSPHKKTIHDALDTKEPTVPAFRE